MTSERRAAEGSAGLNELVEAAGAALSDAAKAISGDAPSVPTAVAISEAELTLKVAVESVQGRALRIRPVSTDDLRSALSAAGVSEVKIRFVTVDEGPKTALRPTKSFSDVLDDFRKRPDIARLGAILQDLQVDASFVPDQGRWLVTARDASGRVVREAIINDQD